MIYHIRNNPHNYVFFPILKATFRQGSSFSWQYNVVTFIEIVYFKVYNKYCDHMCDCLDNFDLFKLVSYQLGINR